MLMDLKGRQDSSQPLAANKAHWRPEVHKALAAMRNRRWQRGAQAADLSYSGMSKLWAARACRENQGKRSWCPQQEGCVLDIRGTMLTLRKDAVWGRLWNALSWSLSCKGETCLGD